MYVIKMQVGEDAGQLAVNTRFTDRKGAIDFLARNNSQLIPSAPAIWIEDITDYENNIYYLEVCLNLPAYSIERNIEG